MFDRIKKAFSTENPPAEAPVSHLAAGPVSEWAQTKGFGFSIDDKGKGLELEGKVSGKPWRMQLGRPSRNYILGQEVRARGELGIDEGVSVLVINRPLKEALEKSAYQMYTDPLQTSANSRLPEEMRLLSMFDEVGWESLPMKFWSRVAVLSDRRESAKAWIDQPLADLMMHWPGSAPSAEVPFLMMLLNGKVYLRMEYTPADVMTLQHAAQIFTNACVAALEAFKPRA